MGNSALLQEKNAEGGEATPAMLAPMDLCSTESHGHHLQDEAARERTFSLRSTEALVKSEQSTTVFFRRRRSHSTPCFKSEGEAILLALFRQASDQVEVERAGSAPAPALSQAIVR